jgi:hypothetical protein
MGTTPPRIFVPPYADPGTTNVHPLQWRLTDLIGTQMALRLEEHTKSGVISSYQYDAYWPGGTKNTACLKNVVGLLTEVASARIATPVFVDRSELSGNNKGLPDYRPQMNFPNPWPGGWWRLRDIVDYELIASNSLLETCSRQREQIVGGCYEMARRQIEIGTEGGPYGYVIPPGQRDAAAAAQLVDILRENGLEARIAPEGLSDGEGRRFAPGSIVFLAAQPYRGFLVEMMERQRYPELRQGPDSKEIFKPYDVPAWTLPLLMGVAWSRLDAPVADRLEPLTATPWPAGGVSGSGGAGFVFSAANDQSARLANGLLARGIRLERALAAVTDVAQAFEPGDFLAPPAAASLIDTMSRSVHVNVSRLERMPLVARGVLRAPRVGLYKPWAASLDEGWTRLVLDRHGFTYASLDNAGVQAKGMGARFDAIILPDMEKNVIVEGKPRSDAGPGYFEPLPPPYAGGIGKDGVAALKAFVEAGGTLVCLGASSGLAIDEFNIPVRNVVARTTANEFSFPGTLVNLQVDPSQPLAFGMPSECTAYYTAGGPVFATSVPGANVGRTVVARFPEYPDQVVASGWGDGMELVTGRGAVVEVTLGKGRVVLFGPRVQPRGQMVGTYKCLFNALLGAAMGR